MGKTAAEIQKAYRERKKLKEGTKYLDRENQRVKAYYVPVTEMSKRKAAERREKIRKNVQKHREKKKLQSVQEPITVSEDSNIQEDTITSTSDSHNDPAGPRFLVVKLPSLDPKKRSRTRISRATSKCRRQIKKLEEENKDLQRKYKRVSKRFERLSKRNKSNEKSTEQSGVTDTIKLTPRKRSLQELRDEGISPSKIPKKIQDKIVAVNVIADEIRDAYVQNDQKGKTIIRSIVSGKHVQKYKLKTTLGRVTGINRKVFCNKSKKINLKQKATRNQKTMLKIKREVSEFLKRDDNSRVMPGKNDKVKIKDGYVQKRVLNDSLSYLHIKYNAEATRKISFATFCRMRPKEIALTKYISRNKCLCQKHQNMALILKSMKNAGASVPLNPDEYGRKLSENSDQMNEFLNQIKGDQVTTQQWKKVEQSDGKKKTKIVQEQLDKDVFLNKVRVQSAEFIEHCSRIKTQYKAMRNLKDNMPHNHCLIQMDFAENFICTSADEVQSAYWNSTAVTLHPVVSYYKGGDTLKHKNYVVVSDDLGHNIGLVYAMLKEILNDVKERMTHLEYIHYWTDSPSSQYRNKTAFYIVSDHKKLFGVPASWNYFESGHGKGACDGIGGTAKRTADMGIKQGKFIVQDAKDFYRYVPLYHKSAAYMFVSTEQVEVSRQEVAEMNKNIVPLKGTMQVHSITGIERGKVRSSITSCYCQLCLRGDLHSGTENTILKINAPVTNEGSNEDASEHTASSVSEDVATNESEQTTTNDETNTSVLPRVDNKMSVSVHQFEPDDWVAVSYEGNWHVGKIKTIDEADGEIEVTFLRKSKGENSETTYKWPEPEDILDINPESIICKINNPDAIGRSGRSYRLKEEDFLKIAMQFNS